MDDGLLENGKAVTVILFEYDCHGLIDRLLLKSLF